MQVYVPPRDSHIDIFHVNKSVELDLPVVSRVAPIPAAEADRSQDSLEVNLIFLVGSEAIVEELNVRALVVEVPGKRFLAK